MKLEKLKRISGTLSENQTGANYIFTESINHFL